jgi:hypothetical protein
VVVVVVRVLLGGGGGGDGGLHVEEGLGVFREGGPHLEQPTQILLDDPLIILEILLLVLLRRGGGRGEHGPMVVGLGVGYWGVRGCGSGHS